MDIKEFLRRAIHSKFMGNTGWLLFQNIYSMLLSLLVGALSARYLGPSNYGLIGYGASMVSLFSSLSQLGLNDILVNELLIRPDEKGKTMGTALMMRLAASLVSFCCVLIMVSVIEPGNKLLLFITALQSFAIICQAYELINQWFLSELESKVYAIAASAGVTAVGVWRIFLLMAEASVAWFAAATTIQALVCGLIVWWVFFRKKPFSLSVDFGLAKKMFSKSKHYIISGFAVAIYTQMDKVMLGKLMGETEVGLYSAAMTIAMLWEFIPQAFINSARAVILERRQRDYGAYLRLLRLLFLGISVMGLAVGLFIQIFGDLAVFLLYGEAYSEAGSVLKLLIWSTSFAMIGVARLIWDVGENKNLYAKYYTMAGGIFNLIFNYLTIPVWGMYGAALGTLFSQIIVALIAPLFWKETRPFVRLYFESWRIRSTLDGLFRKKEG